MNPADLWITFTSSEALTRPPCRPSFWAAEPSASMPKIPPLRPRNLASQLSGQQVRAIEPTGGGGEGPRGIGSPCEPGLVRVI
jgi:hypothetical protein